MTWLAIIMVIVMNLFLYKTPLGLKIRAVGENKNAAESVGISSRKIQYIALIISGVLGLSLLLFRLYASAEDPQEQYQMTEEYVRSGYGRSAVYSDFDKTTSATFSPRYIELSRKGKAHRIYVPEEDMMFVRDYILSRLPAETDITRL